MTLGEENKKLIALGELLDSRVRKAENNVGIWSFINKEELSYIYHILIIQPIKTFKDEHQI